MDAILDCLAVRQAAAPRRGRRPHWRAACLVSSLAMLCAACNRSLSGDFADWPVDANGYQIEKLPFNAASTFVRGNDLYIGLPTGEIVMADDRDLSQPWTSLGTPFEGGQRLLFASSEGAVFASVEGHGVYRNDGGGGPWQVVLDTHVWRMDEDDQGALYAGNYTKDERPAALFKSTDGGRTWAEVFRDDTNHHIHTVRWDERARRLLIAVGDGRTRGRSRCQAASDDRGATWTTLARGSSEGHTDVALTDDFVIWCSDDQSGRILRSHRDNGRTETLTAGSQFIWFGVGAGSQVYVGTMVSKKAGGERAALLASADQGATWQKLLESPPSDGPYTQGFSGESRRLSANGWVYVNGDAQGYGAGTFRVRRRP